MVPADSDRIPRVPPYSGGTSLSITFPVPDYHSLRCDFPFASGSVLFDCRCSYNPTYAVTYMVWALSISLATTLEIDAFFLFLRVLRCFSYPGSPIITDVHSLQLCGLPHSDICGSKPVCSSPQLFAAYHVLLRRVKPRHPPFALILFVLSYSHLASLLNVVSIL